MGIQVFESQEEMDDAFEDMMEAEQERARLREEIIQQGFRVEQAYEEWSDAKFELEELENALEALEDA